MLAKKCEKSVSCVWWECGKALPLHPQSREIRGKLEMVKTKMRLETHFKKNFLKKNFEKVLVVSKIVLTFASAFEKEAIKKSSLKDLDMNKQVVQFLLK
jgi:hypothetical protein